MNTHTAAELYDCCAADGWGPYTGLDSRAYAPVSVRYVTQPYGVSSVVRSRSVDSVMSTPVGVGPGIFVPRLPIDQNVTLSL